MTAARARDRLVDGLRRAGRVRTAAVEEALRIVPRHLFLPELTLRQAYADEAVPVRQVAGVPTSAASQPSMMAIMLEQLDVRPGHRVLEIGAGTGYNAALLAHLAGPGGSVTSVEIDGDLVVRARAHLRAAATSGVSVLCGDGALGHPAGAPYDRVVLTVGSPDVRPEWVLQLAPGGRLLLPLGLRGSQVSVAFDLGQDGVLRSRSVRGCAFVRLQGVGAEDDPRRPVPGTPWTVQPADPSHPPDPAVLAAALADRAPDVPVAGPVTADDLWDGFGLFAALTVPGTCRLLRTGGGSGEPFDPVAPGTGSPAVVGAGGLAVLTALPGSRAAARGFGPDGPLLAARLAAAVDDWAAAGRPDVARLELAVSPRAAARVPPGPEQVEVLTEHCRIVAGWAPGTA